VPSTPGKNKRPRDDQNRSDQEARKFSKLFAEVAKVGSREVGRAWVFALALGTVVVWAVSGRCDGTPSYPEDPEDFIPSARPGSRSPHVWLGEGCSTLDHYGRVFVLIRFGTNAPDVSALKSEAEVRSENDTGPGYQEGWRSADLHDAAGSFSNRWLDGFFDPHVGEGQVAPRPVAIPAHAGRRRGKKISGASRRDSFVLRNNFAGPLSIAAA
jgi:hypothetical protein